MTAALLMYSSSIYAGEHYHEGFILIFSLVHSNWLREARPYHYQWIFGKVPNGLWPPPPPLFWEKCCDFFQNYDDQHWICNEIFWIGNDPPPISKFFRKFMTKSAVSNAKKMNRKLPPHSEIFQNFIHIWKHRLPLVLRIHMAHWPDFDSWRRQIYSISSIYQRLKSFEHFNI